jgi:putative zinc finger protein
MTTPHEAAHADVTVLRAYADGTASPVAAASVEEHLMLCGSCRETFAPLVPAPPLDETWARIRTRVEAPRPSAAERLATRLGLSAESARILCAVPAFRGAWMLGVFVVTLFSLTAGAAAEQFGLAIFLLLAPLAPVAGVAACFGGDADPCFELVTVTPYSSFRLLLLRTAGVLATAVPAAVLVGYLLPGPAWLAVAWLTPAVAAVVSTLVLGPVVGATPAAVIVAAPWTAAVMLAAYAREPLGLVGPAAQVVLATVAVAAVVVLLVRQHSFDHLGRQS